MKPISKEDELELEQSDKEFATAVSEFYQRVEDMTLIPIDSLAKLHSEKT